MKKVCLLVFFIIVLILISFININYFNKYQVLTNEEEIIKEEIIDNNTTIINNEENRELNYINNQVGYINIKDTNIDSRIMQYTDNDYYLTHDEYGNYSIFGSIYMDYRNKINDKKILLFGHNTKNTKTSPFKDLEKYGNESFYSNHSIIDLELNGISHHYKIFSIIVITNQSNKHMKLNFKNDEWSDHLKWLKEDSLYNTNIEVDPNDKIITLQTCYYNPDETFIIISAKEIK